MKQEVIWPYIIGTPAEKYRCAVCDIEVEFEHDPANDIYSPVSRYWNVKKKEVYCSAEHVEKIA